MLVRNNSGFYESAQERTPNPEKSMKAYLDYSIDSLKRTQ